MDLGIAGKRALVLGATKGLGRGIAEALAADGAAVALTGRKQEDASRAADEVASATGATVRGLAFDAADPSAAAALVSSARSALGGVDILLLNGGGPPPGPISQVSPETWRAQFQQQFLGFVEVASAFVPGMRERKWGRVLISSSSGAVQPIPNIGISNSLRGALLGWAKTLAGEVAPDNVTINTILPGRIRTARLDQMDAVNARDAGKTVEEIRAASRAAIPAERFGTPEEYGMVAAFLLSDHAGYVTGSMVRVDGGLIRSI